MKMEVIFWLQAGYKNKLLWQIDRLYSIGPYYIFNEPWCPYQIWSLWPPFIIQTLQNPTTQVFSYCLTVQDFLIKLGIKPRIYLKEISIFSLNHVNILLIFDAEKLNYFESTNFEIFDEVVHNYGKSNHDMI